MSNVSQKCPVTIVDESKHETSVSSWRDWFKNDTAVSVRDILKRDMQKSRPNFDQQVSGGLWDIVKASKVPGSWAGDDVWVQANNMPLEELLKYIQKEVSILRGAQLDLARKRDTGWKKVTTGTQQFVLSFGQFIEAYSGIVNVIKEVDSQYGGAATAILSLLYATVRLKAKDEEAITSAMQNITDRLPDMEIYQHIYADPQLGVMLATVYVQIMSFVRNAVSYVTGHGHRRVFKSMGRPEKFVLMDQEMRNSFTNVRVRCEALLAKRIAHLSKTNNELLQELTAVKKELVELKTDFKENVLRGDNHEVVLLRKSLGLEISNPLEDRLEQVKGHRRLLRNIFGRYHGDIKRLDLSELRGFSEYREWYDSDTSAILTLQGSNASGYSLGPYSWLSEPVCELIETTLNHSDTGDNIVYCLREDEASTERWLAALTIQLLELHPYVVRRGSDLRKIDLDISRTIEKVARPIATNMSTASTSEAIREKLKSIESALIRIINRISTQIYIVIDGAEQCKAARSSFLECLVQIAEQTNNIVKILLVSRQHYWDLEDNFQQLNISNLSCSILHLRINQKEL